MNSSFKNISVQDFSKIINGPDRSLYQIVDVREKGELQDLALHGDDVLNLPISDLSNWGGKVVSGELLDASKPVLCMCKLGGRSAKAAEYLVTQAKFKDVWNVMGGITAYATEIDPTVARR